MKLTYVHDPLRSWCWAFRTVWLRLKAKLASRIVSKVCSVGWRPIPSCLPEATSAYVIGNLKRIQEFVPDTRFNFDFWTLCQPRRSTFPACRAVVAAGLRA
jgi:putative protein-disulfide isomerase